MMLHIFVRRVYPVVTKHERRCDVSLFGLDSLIITQKRILWTTPSNKHILGVTYCADKFHQTYVTRTIKSLIENNAICINF